MNFADGLKKIETRYQESRRKLVLKALRANNWNYHATARSLGMHRNTFLRLRHSLGLDVADARTYDPVHHEDSRRG
jgi:transcriptional regulator of acetoin/glycerol metabolism